MQLSPWNVTGSEVRDILRLHRKQLKSLYLRWKACVTDYVWGRGDFTTLGRQAGGSAGVLFARVELLFGAPTSAVGAACVVSTPLPPGGAGAHSAVGEGDSP